MKIFYLAHKSSIWPGFSGIDSVQFSSVTQSCPTLGDPMNRSTPGLPVHHKLPEFTQTHAHRVSDAIQPYPPLSSPSPPAPSPSQHHGLFQWVNSSHEVAKVLEFQIRVTQLELKDPLPKNSLTWLASCCSRLAGSLSRVKGLVSPRWPSSGTVDFLTSQWLGSKSAYCIKTTCDVRRYTTHDDLIMDIP